MFNLVPYVAVVLLINVSYSIQHTSSNLWHQLPVSFKIKLWALRSAWTLTKSFYSSELNALHYYLISRSTQAGITAHPEPVDELCKAFSVQISQS